MFHKQQIPPQLSCLAEYNGGAGLTGTCLVFISVPAPDLFASPLLLSGTAIIMHLLHSQLPYPLTSGFGQFQPGLSSPGSKNTIPFQAKGWIQLLLLLLLSGTLISNGGSLMFYSWFYSYSYKWSLYKNFLGISSEVCFLFPAGRPKEKE